MKKTIVLPTLYMPPISWFAELAKQENEIILEQHEYFPKQTYRNRTHILGANGMLPLIIPIQHNGKKSMFEVEVSNAENWRNHHWKSIVSAYKSSPYFEYYEDKIKSIYTEDGTKLIDINCKTIDVFIKILKLEVSFTMSETYVEIEDLQDYRDVFSPKKKCEKAFPPYYQVFSEKLGFHKNLSILDLICNKGPESGTYLSLII